MYTYVRSKGDNILYRGYDKDGNIVIKTLPFTPKYYIKTSKEKSNTKIRGFGGDYFLKEKKTPLSKYGSKMRELREMGIEVFGDNRPTYQFLSKLNTSDININFLRKGFFDIEVYSVNGFPLPELAEGPVISIVYYDSKLERFFIFGIKDWDNKKNIKAKYIKCKDEIDLLTKFFNLLSRIKPDILTGWCSNQFDIPYIYTRAQKLGLKNALNKISVFNKVELRTKEIKNRARLKFITTIWGTSLLDYQDLYKQYARSYPEDYKLNTILNLELGESKVDFSDEYDNLNDLYDNNHQLFIDYNIQDVAGLINLDKKLKFIDLAASICYDAKINLEDYSSPVRIWESLIYNECLKRGIATPPSTVTSGEKYRGAYVKQPQISMHEYIASFDLNSLYPNIIIQHNISPETLLEDDEIPRELIEIRKKITVDWLIENYMSVQEILKKYNVTMTVNGEFFTLEKEGILPYLMKEKYSIRRMVKDEMLQLKSKMEKETNKEEKNKLDVVSGILDLKQLAQKIILNSGYGAFGSSFFNMSDKRIAEAITVTGQFLIRIVENEINKKIAPKVNVKDMVIAVDTDSLYIRMGELLRKKYNINNMNMDKIIDTMDLVCKKFLEPFIKSIYDKVTKCLNVYENRMVMKREVLASKALWVARKKYMMKVHDNEGVRFETPHLKIMGVQIIQSSTPKVVKEKLKQFVNLLFDYKNIYEIKDFIRDFKTEFKKMKVEDIAFPRGVSELNKWVEGDGVKKGCPIHVRASLLYNRLLKLEEFSHLRNTYDFIQEGEKIKFVYIIKPNKYNEHVVAFLTKLPPEFGIHSIIDYETQFEKVFNKFATDILKIAGIEINVNKSFKDCF